MSELVEAFSDFFIQKVKGIKASIRSLSTHDIPRPDPVQTWRPMSTLQPASGQEIHRIILASPNKQCDLDPVPAKLLKLSLDLLLPIITYIINRSLATGEFPDVYKTALVTPILKK